MAATRRKSRKKAAGKSAPATTKTGLLTTWGTRIKKIATGLVTRKKKRKPAKKTAAKRKPRAPKTT